MTLTPQAIENAARAMRDITFNALTMDECRDAAKAALSAVLGDMVLVPKEAVTYASQMADICFDLKQSSALDFSTRKAMDETQSGFDRAMIAAAEAERCK